MPQAQLAELVDLAANETAAVLEAGSDLSCFSGVLPKGTPVAQCIPVKRNNWEANFGVIEAEGVTKRYAERTIVRDFSLRIQRGDRIGVVGANGTGKTTLLKLLTGEIPRPEDWLPRDDWPHPDQVGHVFGRPHALYRDGSNKVASVVRIGRIVSPERCRRDRARRYTVHRNAVAREFERPGPGFPSFGPGGPNFEQPNGPSTAPSRP